MPHPNEVEMILFEEKIQRELEKGRRRREKKRKKEDLKKLGSRWCCFISNEKHLETSGKDASTVALLYLAITR